MCSWRHVQTWVGIYGRDTVGAVWVRLTHLPPSLPFSSPDWQALWEHTYMEAHIGEKLVWPGSRLMGVWVRGQPLLPHLCQYNFLCTMTCIFKHMAVGLTGSEQFNRMRILQKLDVTYWWWTKRSHQISQVSAHCTRWELNRTTSGGCESQLSEDCGSGWLNRGSVWVKTCPTLSTSRQVKIWCVEIWQPHYIDTETIKRVLTKHL